jgi:hypothetical protein
MQVFGRSPLTHLAREDCATNGGPDADFTVRSHLNSPELAARFTSFGRRVSEIASSTHIGPSDMGG